MIPGGLVEPNETLEQAVVREVKEETNINATVKSMICVRELPSYLFQRFDLYFVFLMHADKEGQEIIKQDDEVSLCEWVTYDTFIERLPSMAPTIQKIGPYFDTESIELEKVLDKCKDIADDKKSTLELMSFANKPYQYDEKKNNMYVSKLLKDVLHE